MKNKTFLDGHSLSTEMVFELAKDLEREVAINDQVTQRIVDSRSLLLQFVDEKRVIYGVNTSLGGFVNWLVPNQYAETLQNNLIAAVATNVGPYFEDKVVRAAMLARLNSLARGTSAISLENFNILLRMFNEGIIPCIPSKGISWSKWRFRASGLYCVSRNGQMESKIQRPNSSWRPSSGTSWHTPYEIKLQRRLEFNKWHVRYGGPWIDPH
jgi:hypothetical protein